MEVKIYGILKDKGLHSEKDMAAKEIEGLGELDANEIEQRYA